MLASVNCKNILAKEFGIWLYLAFHVYWVYCRHGSLAWSIGAQAPYHQPPLFALMINDIRLDSMGVQQSVCGAVSRVWALIHTPAYWRRHVNRLRTAQHFDEPFTVDVLIHVSLASDFIHGGFSCYISASTNQHMNMRHDAASNG